MNLLRMYTLRRGIFSVVGKQGSFLGLAGGGL